MFCVSQPKVLALVSAAVLLLGVFFLVFPHSKEALSPMASVALHEVVVSFGQTVIHAELADTPELHERGLYGRESLSDGHGMLFVFPKSGEYGFWMKGMRFPIDIVWINAQHEVVGVERNVSPDSFPKVFYPPVPISLVLEVPAGFCDTHGIKVGDVVREKR